MFDFIKNAFNKIYQQFSSKLAQIFGQSTINQETLNELEKILISADTGVNTTRIIINNLKTNIQNGSIQKGEDLQLALSNQLKNILLNKTYNTRADVFLLVGINGSGKTTFAAKLGNWLKNQNKKVLFVAADTFRAAAREQLAAWANKLDIDIVMGKENQDPASVVFMGCEQFKNKNYDCLIIDTAGRLQTKTNLMNELEKIKKNITKLLPNNNISTLLTIDSMLGQNSFEQAKVFNECTKVDGIVLTKLDGTGKGGIVFSIVQELKIPIAFISFGEQPDQITIFDPEQYINQLIINKN